MGFIKRRRARKFSLDLIPGWKTYLSSAVTALFNIARAKGWVDLPPEVVDAINVILIAAIGASIAARVSRVGRQVSRDVSRAGLVLPPVHSERDDA